MTLGSALEESALSAVLPEGERTARFQDGACLGLVAAFAREVSPLLRGRAEMSRLGPQLFRFSLRGGPAVLAVAGAGASNACRAARELAGRVRLAGLISIGYAAGLQPELRPGMVMVADEVIEEGAGKRVACDPGLLPGVAWCRGALLSVHGVINSAAEKQRLGRRWSAMAADMESAGVARAAQEARLPFAAVKCVTDGSSESIAIDFQRCGNEQEGLATWKIVREALTSVRGMRDLIRLAGASRRASENLALALGPL